VAPATLFKVPHLQKVPYDPMTGLNYVMAFSAYTFALVVPEASPWKTWQEFAAYAKANPGKVNVGTTGTGSSGHVAIHMLAQKTGADLNFIPYKGGSEVLQAFVGGHINAVIDGGWAQVERQGKGRVLLAFTDKRLPRLPNVPTARESGIDLVANSPIGIVVPKGWTRRSSAPCTTPSRAHWPTPPTASTSKPSTWMTPTSAVKTISSWPRACGSTKSATWMPWA